MPESLNCDLCGDEVPHHEILIWPVGFFTIPDLDNMSPLWGVCVTCGDLVKADAWPALLDRVVASYKDERLRPHFARLHEALRKQGAALRKPTPEDWSER